VKRLWRQAGAARSRAGAGPDAPPDPAGARPPWHRGQCRRGAAQRGGAAGLSEVTLARLAAIWPELGAIPPEIAEQLEIDARYAGYIERQSADIVAFRRDEALLLPEHLDYGGIGSLSSEIRGKLSAARPATLGAAGGISG